MLRPIRSPLVLAAFTWAACTTPPDERERPDDNGAAPAAQTTPAPAERPKPIVTGQLAPALALPDVESGAAWSLDTYLDPTGASSPKGFLVAFMASWCQYCDQSLPTLVELEQANPDLAVVTVTVDDRPETRKAELEKVRKAGLTGPVLAADADAVATWIGGGRSVPRYYFIDHNGVVTAQDQGFGDNVKPRMPAQVRRALAD